MRNSLCISRNAMHDQFQPPLRYLHSLFQDHLTVSHTGYLFATSHSGLWPPFMGLVFHHRFAPGQTFSLVQAFKFLLCRMLDIHYPPPQCHPPTWRSLQRFFSSPFLCVHPRQSFRNGSLAGDKAQTPGTPPDPPPSFNCIRMWLNGNLIFLAVMLFMLAIERFSSCSSL